MPQVRIDALVYCTSSPVTVPTLDTILHKQGLNKRNMRARSPGTGQAPRQRTLDDNSEIVTSGAFFSGASVESRRLRRGEAYPGDREIKVTEELTVQIHILDLLDRQSGAVIAQRVPAVAIWIPAEMGTDTLVQDLPA
jgi:hypothetical protein